MKKYIISAMALLAMLVTSCSNEDITIEAPSTISVNAAGVISHFQEYKAGELEVMDSGRKLRLRALVYNSNGELVAQHTDYFTNYNVQLKTSEFLSPGTYTVIGISDVVKMQGNTVGTEWWTLSGERKLSDMVIKDQGMIGYDARILGIGKANLVVQGSRSNSTVVDLKPAGALVYVFLENTSSLSDRNITGYTLWSNKSSEAVSFNSNGDYNIVEDNDPDYIHTIVSLEPSDGYLFNYILPMNNVQLWFTATEDGADKTFPTDEGTTISILAGDEYECDLILNKTISKIETRYYKIDLSNTRNGSSSWSNNWRESIGCTNVNNGNTYKKMIKSDKPLLSVE